MLCKISSSVRLFKGNHFSFFPIVSLQSDSVVDLFSLKQKPCVLILPIFMVVPKKKNLISPHKNPCSSIFKDKILIVLHQEKYDHHLQGSPLKILILFFIFISKAIHQKFWFLSPKISTKSLDFSSLKALHRKFWFFNFKSFFPESFDISSPKLSIKRCRIPSQILQHP